MPGTLRRLVRRAGLVVRPRVALLPALGAALMFVSPGTRAQAIPGWNLVWADEFDGPDIDLTKWEHEVNGWGGGNNELQYYTARPANSFIQNGALVIRALKETYTGPDGRRSYTSARMRTKYKGDWTYGRFEARMKLPYGQGIWPAFWMLPTDNIYGGWAASGEIDIMELVGHEPNKIHGTIHYHGEWPDNWSSGNSWTLPSGDFSDDFHVFAVEWEEGVMRWYVDGILFSTQTWWDTTGGAPFPAPFDQRFHLLLNLAVGGNWPGSPNGSTVFPQELEVDYVRVYSRTAAPAANELVNGGFESGGLSPWVGYAPGGANHQGGYVESTSNTYYNGGNPGGDNVLTRSGTYVGKTFGDFTGGENYNGFYQDLVATPGSLWTAGGWALTHTQDLMSGGNSSWVEVTFRDASDTILRLYRSPVLESATVTANTWNAMPVTTELNPSTKAVIGTASVMTAPAGTTKVRYEAVYRQPAFGGGAMYFDDLYLSQLPGLPLSLNSTRVGNNIELSFPTQPGVTYEMVSKTNLAEPTWTPIETIVGDGNVKTVSYPLGDQQRFYRVVIP